MKPLPKLRRIFLTAISVAAVTVYSRPLSDAYNDNAKATSTTYQDAQAVEKAHFDYAFGDQVAGSFGLPGATGEKWGIDKTMKGLKEFLAKDPEALRGKKVIVAIGDCTYDESGRKDDLAYKLQDAVGPGGVIMVMGISETYKVSVLGIPINVNKKIQKYIAEYNKKTNNFVYGGAIKGATSKDNIYPVTPEAFKAVREQAVEKLNQYLTPPAVEKKTLPVFRQNVIR